MKNLIVIHSGANRGIWLASHADKDRVLESMSGWTSHLQGIAQNLKVRVYSDEADREYLSVLAGAEFRFGLELEIIDQDLGSDVDEFPHFPNGEDIPYGPRLPSGTIPPFKTETVEHGKGEGSLFEICPDGVRVGLGSWGKNHE